jgi:glycosyltransferase involved in cell wall biosynthesis
MLLTIGMATVRDYDGPWATITSLRLAMRDLAFVNYEIILVDNDPDHPRGKACAEECRQADGQLNQGCRYVPFPEAFGTTQPRQRVFDEARGDWVVCMDSHVMMGNNAWACLIDYCRNNTRSKDIISGPLLYNDLKRTSEAFAEEWRSQMWGVWTSDARVELGKPFETWAQGLGFFAMRKAAWPGFDRRWRGFGGEEGCIHEAIRQAGGRSLCVPQIEWAHRWGKPDGTMYQAYTWHKVRNYVLGFQRIGRDIAEIHKHFVLDEKNFAQELWDALIADPDAENPPGVVLEMRRPTIESIVAAGAADAPWKPEFASGLPLPTDADLRDIRTLAEWCAATPRDLDQHAMTLAQECEGFDVVEVTKRRESAAFILLGCPRSLTTFSREHDPLYSAIHVALRRTAAPKPEYRSAIGTTLNTLALEIPACDALYIDSIHSAERIYAELTKHGPRVRSKIIVRGTGDFGDIAEGGGAPGLYYGVYRWIEEEAGRGRTWVLTRRETRQYGMAVWSCDPQALPLATGPGTELADILRSMGIASGSGCDCKARQATMDQWGVAKCRENRAVILGWIEEGAPRWGWADRLKAMALAVASGVAWSLSPTDPYGSLIDLAIDRAEAKERQRAEWIAAANEKLKGGAT